MRHLRNIFNLGIKELRSLLGDKKRCADCLLVYGVVIASATVTPGSLNSRRSP